MLIVLLSAAAPQNFLPLATNLAFRLPAAELGVAATLVDALVEDVTTVVDEVKAVVDEARANQTQKRSVSTIFTEKRSWEEGWK
jgi:hypothetical protein